MSSYFCFTVRFLQPHYHGRADAGEPEWPPSPLRAYQALVAAAAKRSGVNSLNGTIPALRWFEQQPFPSIMAARGVAAEAPYRLYVPDNVGDKVARSWTRGGNATIANFRTEKDVCPVRLPDIAEVHYLFPLDNEQCPHLEVLAGAARSITHLGWGVDMVVANITILSEQEAAALPGERWRAAEDPGANGLRVPITGTLDALIAKHEAFLNRIARDAKGNESFNPVPPLAAFHVVGYRRATDPVTRPSVVFHLRNDDDSFFRYPQRKLIHLAGMVRHLAIQIMKDSPPGNVADKAAWVRSYVAGHREPDVNQHRQFSYLPLPSIGHQHTDPSVRRIMIAAPLGDDRLLYHLARLLEGQRLEPTRRTKLDHPPTLVRVKNDNIARYYTRPATSWASVTPVILPGHDDHKPGKTRKLIAKALQQSGVEQPCEFEWTTFSHFPNSLSAYKCDRDKKQIGYIRPDHLGTKTAVHLKLRFHDDLKILGPLVIGSGRHCGLGLMAGADSRHAHRVLGRAAGGNSRPSCGDRVEWEKSRTVYFERSRGVQTCGTSRICKVLLVRYLGKGPLMKLALSPRRPGPLEIAFVNRRTKGGYDAGSFLGRKVEAPLKQRLYSV